MYTRLRKRLVSLLILFQMISLVSLFIFAYYTNYHNLMIRNTRNVESFSVLPQKPTTGHPSNSKVASTTQQLNIEDLASKIESGFRRNLLIKFGEIDGKLTFKYEKLNIPPKIENLDRKERKRSFNKYVFVYSEYTEQLSQSLRSVLSLCGQAQFGGRKVVRPFVKNGRLLSKEKYASLGALFDLNHLDKLLENSTYSPLVDKPEYDVECKRSDPNHVTIHFLYIGGVTKNWNLGRFKISREYYDSIFEKTKSKGWTKCLFLDEKMGKAPSKKQYCVNPSIITNWKVLERDIIGGGKCLNIYLWRGIGGGVYRTYFTENKLPFSHDAIQFALKPSKAIENEVTRFRKIFLPDRFIALYVRAEFILVPHKYDFEYLGKCIDVLVEIVNAIKSITGISHVHVASDMSKHGSNALISYVSKAKLKSNPFPDIYNSLVSRVAGVSYNYNASESEIRDRGAVALVDLNILSHAQYLITAGNENMSSFLRWVIGSFLANRREDHELWSKISVCGK